MLCLLCFGTISTDTVLAKLSKYKTPPTRGFLFGNGQGTPTVGEQTARACNSPQRIATHLDSHQATNCTKARRMACYTPAALHSIMRTLTNDGTQASTYYKIFVITAALGKPAS